MQHTIKHQGGACGRIVGDGWRYLVWWLALVTAPHALASPWLAPNDPFLRADLTALSDAGELLAPINHYPLRWSSFYDEVAPKRQLTHDDTRQSMLNTARQHVRYRAYAAKFNRAPIGFDLQWANEAASSLSYGDTPRHEWLVGTYYQHMRNRFAFKVANQYRRDANGDKEYTWQGSYLALNEGRWLFTVGQLERWWGQGWQHNLIWGNQSAPATSASLSYLGQVNPVLGYWSFETVYQLPEKTGYDGHWAGRLVSQPLRAFQYGVTYQRWTNPDSGREESEQWAWDAKLALPAGTLPFAHALYGELASDYQGNELAASLMGWSGQTELAGQSVRVVLERQQTHTGFETDLRTTPGVDQAVSSTQLGGNSTTYGLAESHSAAAYVQLANDHAIAFTVAEREAEDQQWQHADVSYRLPAFTGMVTLGASRTDGDAPNNEQDTTRYWVKYQLRF
ncbi:capsule assembly Wzi family protein [Salinivibrio sp. IB282]|uniref:capsule assembly Wzi family protein n=1 Tax=Salinivibrio sp. IB282 TaxID=1766122 RepID=UPI0009C80618|nr:capsule assembly Wzi family protein [Salinivibrio sp. IB282]OOE62715.1 hypothetical protein BZG14_10865 [Salinivibrio sp. IB282]